ncbi:Calsyntenin-2 [Anabarilius grahami]|uniref:Calsyntenin-2 n=1 Tax=Anabarilius grahami TaxID=495550 RepID=A0A3N0YW36_ANAGA|nr:Calsyntenin-2 [Anabarilius grahami]
MHLETCDGSVSWIRTTVELESSVAGRGCDRQSYSERSSQKLCGASSGSTDLLPAPSGIFKWTATLVTDSGRDSDLTYRFDGRQAAKIPDWVVPQNLTNQFTITTWMKHGPSPGQRAEKETLLCNSDKTEMNRHHYSLYVHNCRLVFLLRTDYTQTDSFRPAEFHWKLEQHPLVDGIYLAASEHFVLKVDVLEAGKMGKRKVLSEFDKGQIVMARRLIQSISKTAALVGCSRSAVVSIYQKWFNSGEPVTGSWAAKAH